MGEYGDLLASVSGKMGKSFVMKSIREGPGWLLVREDAITPAGKRSCNQQPDCLLHLAAL